VARASVVVVGGGISGLAAAWELSGAAQGPSDQTPRVELIESSDHLGGALATAAFAGRTIDLGADGFLARRPEATTLVDELGWTDRLEEIAISGSSIWLRGSLYELPGGLVLGVPTSSSVVKAIKGLSWRARMSAQRDEWFPAALSVGDDASIGEILRTKLGPELTYQFIEPMVGGIQAGRIDELSAKSIFPALLDAARHGGSLMKALSAPVDTNASAPRAPAPVGPMFYTLTSGIGSLADELSRRLAERGIVLRTGTEITALRRTPSGNYPWVVDTANTTTPADRLVLAAPAQAAGRLIGHLDPALAALAGVKSAGAAMVTFSVARTEITLPEHGTGVLVPLGTMWSGEGSMLVTAITFLDRKWPHLIREDDVVLRAHVGRSDDLRWASFSDEELAERVAHELGVLLPRFGASNETLVHRWQPGLPQYYVGHDQMVSGARRAASLLDVALAGNAYDGVGVPASIGSGRRAARETLNSLPR
jgi:oxygen-dependent protoporphyrinogen oxidase